MIVGPTGSGKTGVAIEIAKEVGGEIISADSRAIYCGMDIGTAKPSIEEREGIVHYGFDLVEPGERFTVFDFKKYAEQKICSILEKGKIPIIVGGTGLYVDALVYNYSFTPEAKNNYSDRGKLNPEYVIFGIKTETEELRDRLKKRVEQMFCTELFDETKLLVERYGFSNQAMKSDIYEYAWKYMNGEISLDEAKELCFYRDYHLAKRQITWFKRNDKIIWVPLGNMKETVLKYIHNEQRK